MTTIRIILALALLVTGSLRVGPTADEAGTIRISAELSAPAVDSLRRIAEASSGRIQLTTSADGLRIWRDSSADVLALLVAWAGEHGVAIPTDDNAHPVIMAATAMPAGNGPDAPLGDEQPGMVIHETSHRPTRIGWTDHHPTASYGQPPLAERFALRAPPVLG